MRQFQKIEKGTKQWERLFGSCHSRLEFHKDFQSESDVCEYFVVVVHTQCCRCPQCQTQLHIQVFQRNKKQLIPGPRADSEKGTSLCKSYHQCKASDAYCKVYVVLKFCSPYITSCQNTLQHLVPLKEHVLPEEVLCRWFLTSHHHVNALWYCHFRCTQIKHHSQ